MENMKWISVDERLPENEQMVLVWVGNLYTMSHITNGFVFGVKNKWRIMYDTSKQAGHYSSDYVSHWMPLPTPPKV